MPLANLDARDYLESDNPVAHGLMGLFRRRGLDAARLKAESLRNVVRLTEGEPGLRQLLVGALERYFVLTESQQARYEGLLARSGYREVRGMLTLSEERGMLKALQSTLLRQLRKRFGDVPEDVEAVVRAMREPEEVEPYLDRVLDAGRLEDMHFPGYGQAAGSAP